MKSFQLEKAAAGKCDGTGVKSLFGRCAAVAILGFAAAFLAVCPQAKSADTVYSSQTPGDTEFDPDIENLPVDSEAGNENEDNSVRASTAAHKDGMQRRGGGDVAVSSGTRKGNMRRPPPPGGDERGGSMGGGGEASGNGFGKGHMRRPPPPSGGDDDPGSYASGGVDDGAVGKKPEGRGMRRGMGHRRGGNMLKSGQEFQQGTVSGNAGSGGNE